MKSEPARGFSTHQSTAHGPSLIAAIGLARETVATITALPIDSVGRCERGDAQGWTVQIDVIESAARMGDNDLLATYEVQISVAGEPLNVCRTRRYHREDKDQS